MSADEKKAQPWNVGVVLRDGRTVALRPVGSMSRIIESDGHWSCWHDDRTRCGRNGHETISTYWIEDTPGSELVPAETHLTKAQALVNEQADDPGLWCEPGNIVEAYLQQELRRLHAAIEMEGE